MSDADPLAHIDTGRVPERINVAVNPEEVAALERLILVEHVSLTEAVRRLLGYGDFLHRALTDDGGRLVLHRRDGSTADVTLIGSRVAEEGP